MHGFSLSRSVFTLIRSLENKYTLFEKGVFEKKFSVGPLKRFFVNESHFGPAVRGIFRYTHTYQHTDNSFTVILGYVFFGDRKPHVSRA